MTAFDTFAWYYGYFTIYTFLFGFINHEYLIPISPGYQFHSIDYKTNEKFNLLHLLSNFLWVTVWCSHHSVFLRPSIKDKVKHIIPKNIDVDSLFQVISASIMNIMSFYWFISPSTIGGG